MKHIVQYIIAILTIFTFAGCHEEFMKETPVGEGKARISATLNFKPMSSALARKRTEGTALTDINSLHVLLYDYMTKELKKSWKIEEYDISEEKREDTDAENGTSAETTTKQASFILPEEIKFGQYYLYAVANIPDLLENYSDAIQTVDGLKSIPLEWDSQNISANGQMIGHLTNTSATSQPEVADESIILNEETPTLHAWLRRAASKVTVAFDGSGLKEGVSIYLKSLRIKNIPRTCSLGMNNTVDNENDLIPTGEKVEYIESPLITKEQPFYPRKLEGDKWVMDPDAHSESNLNSIFFYENMQGTGEDKRQSDENHDGILDGMYPYKEKEYATFIEVDAYYESTAPERPGICNITYRFMLGQNITTDYNAKRNCHYKLTLHFNGYADDPDWRIDYVTRLGVTQPNAVDYRGKYFASDGSTNGGHTFKDNTITVTSFMYQNDNWRDRKPIEYKIEYRDANSANFSETPPAWLEKLVPVHEGNGVYKLNIKYNNPYTPVNINTKLSENSPKAEYDLSTKGGKEEQNTANCYIVDSRGTYLFPLVYGNAITNGTENEASYKYKGSLSGTKYLGTFKNYNNQDITSAYILDDIYGENVPSGLSAALVWQDEPNLIDPTSITYVKDEYKGKGGIKFSIGNIKEGNAVIALQDPNGTIMWSWHIWVTAIDLSKKITLTNHDSQNFEIMPVNLGWCSGGIPVRYYERHECEVRFTQYISGDGQQGISKTVKIIQEPHIALPQGNNPYFQWGRKDPFVGGFGNEKDTEVHTKPWYTSKSQQNPNTSTPELMYTGNDEDRVETYNAIAELIKNPNKWQNCPRVINQNPNIGGIYIPQDIIYYNLWDNRLHENDPYVVKTIYDPCPAGYHVSSHKTYSGFTDSGSAIGISDGTVDITPYMYAAIVENMMPKEWVNSNDYNSNILEFYTNKTKLISIGFPQNGYRDWDNNARIHTFNTNGYIWEAQSDIWDSRPFLTYHLEYSRNMYIWPNPPYYATDGFPVRPSKTLP